MSLELYREALDFLVRSGIDRVRLLGGEPTLHPAFPQMVGEALSRGLKLLVFTNGLTPEPALRCLEELPPDAATALVNAEDPCSAPPARIARQRETLRRLGERATLSINLHHLGCDPSFALSWIRELGLAPNVRLGLAHPGGGNSWLRPRQYREAGALVAAFAAQCREQGVSVDFDCGFVPCMFPDGALTDLGIGLSELGRRCSPVLDILSDGAVVHCYPLAGLHRERLTAGVHAADLRSRFAEAFSHLRPAGVFPECSSCALKHRGDCVGGCLAASVTRVQPPRQPATATHRRESSDSPDGSRARWVVAYIDQPLSFWRGLSQDFSAEIREVYLPLPSEVIGSGRPPQPAAHLPAFLRSGLFPVNVVVNPAVLPEPVERIAPRVIEHLRCWHEQFGLAGITLANVLLAEAIHEALPGVPLTASTLLDIATPAQVRMLGGVFSTLVPPGRVMRDLEALRALRRSFPGRVRMLVNEACLPGCPHRTQHFYEMAYHAGRPESLCQPMLSREPWLRLSGAWVLPQHLHCYDGLYDELKLAGRVTLCDPERYRRVLSAYISGSELQPHGIGGGPASVNWPMSVSEGFFMHLLGRDHDPASCPRCREAVSGPLVAVKEGEG